MFAEVAFERPVEDPVFGLAVSTEAGVFVYVDSTSVGDFGSVNAGDRVRFRGRVPLALTSGPYEINVSLRSVQEAANLARPPRPIRIYVSGRNGVHGLADLAADLTVEQLESSESASGD